jgi:uncharacterized protein
MAINQTTPGVYIREVSTLPPSVAPVSTAVPGFAGYTEKGPLATPTRITSMLEFEQIFGGAYTEKFEVSSTTFAVTPVTDTTPANAVSEYKLYYHMQLYFANGGGPCWVSSAGDYEYGVWALVSSQIVDALKVFKQIDEVTLLVAPEYGTAATSPANTYTEMLDQAATLQDRFAIMDVQHATSAAASATAFRNLSLPSTNLRYGAAYYPPVKTTLSYRTSESHVSYTGSTSYPAPYNTVDLIRSGIGESYSVTIAAFAAAPPYSNTTLSITVNGVLTTLVAETDFDTYDGTNYLSQAVIRQNLINAIHSHPALGGKVIVKDDYAISPNANKFIITSLGTGSTLLVTGAGDLSGAAVAALAGLPSPTTPPEITFAGDVILANQLMQAVQNYSLDLSPSAAIAAVYASVDRDRGVWKAPANVSLNAVIQPAVLLNDADQSGLNVDAVSGKSINVIRQFSGKGNLVWGARTLAGNDTEWRYVNVRRLFCFAEESIKKAIEQVVFEPNDRQTWNRVRTMIGNFLTNLWRDGGLVGPTPDQAFYVRVGLGETMTEQDLLDGRLVVKIGMAASRPAEFIELQFSHIVQQG